MFERRLSAASQRLRSAVDAAVQSSTHFGRTLDRAPGFAFLCFSIVYFLGAFSAARVRPLWLDEILALYISSLPSFADIWRALTNALDGNPPLYYLLNRPILSLLGSSGISVRLTAVLGFWLASAAVFLFVRARTSTLPALFSVLLFVHSGAYRWAYEARPYALVLGLAGLAILFWQQCSEPGPARKLKLAGLVLSLAAIVSLHYYSLLVIAPLACAELARTFSRRRFDSGVWIAIAAGACVILLWLPIIDAVRANVAGNSLSPEYFARPTYGALYESFNSLYRSTLLPLVLALIVVVPLLLRRETGDPPALPEILIPLPDLVLASVLTAFPLFCFTFAVLVTGTFHVRYVLPGAMGPSILGGFAAAACFRARPAILVGALGVFFAHFFLTSVLLSGVPLSVPYGDHLSYVSNSTHGDLPIAVAEGLLFVPMRHYSSPPLRDRLFYLTDLATASRTTDTTNENILLAFRDWAPRNILPLEEFISARKRFLVYYIGETGNSTLEALRLRGCRLALLNKEFKRMMFECACP
jgi:hypothetical protein